MIFVWEGCVAVLPGYGPALQVERYRVKLHQWDRAVRMWQLNELALKWMWTILARTQFRIDMVVTSRPPRFAKALAERIQEENWPVRYVFAMPAAELGRRLPTMFDVERVIYGLEEHRWAFGPHGLHLPEAGQVV